MRKTTTERKREDVTMERQHRSADRLRKTDLLKIEALGLCFGRACETLRKVLWATTIIS